MAASGKLLGSPSLIFTYLHQIRWYRPRKPLWMGRAKSKMFRVPPIPIIPTRDEEELKKLYNNYRTHFRSIRAFCRTEYYLTSTTRGENALIKEKDEELEKLLSESEQENQRLAGIREKFLSDEANVAFDKLHMSTVLAAEVKERQIKEAEEEIKQKEILVKSFITPEKLDDAIEKALETVVNYEYAISEDGVIQK